MPRSKTDLVFIAIGVALIGAAIYFVKTADAASSTSRSQTPPPANAVAISQNGTITTVTHPDGTKQVFDLPLGQPVTIPGPR